jgi:hypothetical protein
MPQEEDEAVRLSMFTPENVECCLATVPKRDLLQRILPQLAQEQLVGLSEDNQQGSDGSSRDLAQLVCRTRSEFSTSLTGENRFLCLPEPTQMPLRRQYMSIHKALSSSNPDPISVLIETHPGSSVTPLDLARGEGRVVKDEAQVGIVRATWFHEVADVLAAGGRLLVPEGCPAGVNELPGGWWHDMLRADGFENLSSL